MLLDLPILPEKIVENAAAKGRAKVPEESSSQRPDYNGRKERERALVRAGELNWAAREWTSGRKDSQEDGRKRAGLQLVTAGSRADLS